MSPFELASVFLAIVALSGWVNVKLLHWPSATVMVVAGLLAAGALSLASGLSPGGPAAALVETIRRVDFSRTVLGYMLAFLLFAGAMQVELAELRRRKLAVWTLATLGVLGSTVIVGFGLWATARGLALPLPLSWAIVFGALISPTDPIAVLVAVRQGGLSKGLQAVLQGEALFNDGVGIVVFTAATSVAVSGGALQPLPATGRVAFEALGGGLLGFLGGWICVRAMKAIDDYAVEVSLSLALAIGVYALAGALGLSGPIAVVVAGLLIGDSGMRTAMSDLTQRYVRGFWTLVDDLLTGLLFLMLGLEFLVVRVDLRQVGLWIAGVVLVVLARLAVVFPWGASFHFREQERGASLVLAWGGLHGALSLALALTLPAGLGRDLILPLTFAVVIFSVVVQGLSFGPLVARLARRGPS
jgi:CPA1 family monovalent cation:H+ antiporter